jgi:hypothetical protein
MSDLLKEALADAKAVRATALANAKVALEEAFGERIQAMFAERLKTETAEDESVDPSGIGSGSNKKPVTQSHSEDPGKSDGHVSGTIEEEGVEEITDKDLEEIIAELEKDGGLEEEGEVAPSDPVDAAVAPVAPAAPVDAAAAPVVPVDAAVAPVAPAAPVDAAAAPVAPAAPVDAAAAPVDTTPAVPVAEDGVEEVNLDELLAELEEGSGEEESKEDDAEQTDESAWEEQLREVTAERDEAYKTVEILRSQINEVNLLNAKLLYTNKLFKQFSLNNEQKMKVVESFDLTTNVREVKLTYAIMAESFNLGASVVKKKNTTATTITEGLASKPVASTKPAQEIVAGANEMAARFKTLAGIKK